MTSLAASLRVFARVEDPSAEMFAYLEKKEGVQSPLECWVDIAIPRDFEWSDEIREKTVEFGLADDDGDILATFATLAEAEGAKGRARLRSALAFDDEPKAPKGAAAKPKPVETETDSQTGVTSIVSTAAGL